LSDRWIELHVDVFVIGYLALVKAAGAAWRWYGISKK
jgi:hypothetical protein